MEQVGGQPPDDAIVADETVLAQQQPVTAAARGQLGPGVGVHTVHELDRIRSRDLDLAQGGGVEDAQGCPRGLAFAQHGGVHILSGLREIPGAAPLGDGLEHRAVRLGPGVDGRLAGQLEGLAPQVAAEGAKAGRRIGRAEGRQPHLRRRLAKRVGGDHQPVDVRHLALVGRHAVGGVTLDVFDRAHPFAHGQADVLGGHVVLEVDKGARLAGIAVGRQFGVAGAGAGAVVRHRKARRMTRTAQPFKRAQPRRRTVGQDGLVTP